MVLLAVQLCHKSLIICLLSVRFVPKKGRKADGQLLEERLNGTLVQQFEGLDAKHLLTFWATVVNFA